MSDPDKPGLLTLGWFRPLYRRIIVCCVPLAGIAWEFFYTHDQLWLTIWVIAFGYGIWSFFINYERELARQENNGKPKS